MGRSDVAVEHFIRLLGLAEGQSGGWLDDFALAFQVRALPDVTIGQGRVIETKTMYFLISTSLPTSPTRSRHFRPSSLTLFSTSNGRPSARFTATPRHDGLTQSGSHSRRSTST